VYPCGAAPPDGRRGETLLVGDGNAGTVGVRSVLLCSLLPAAVSVADSHAWVLTDVIAMLWGDGDGDDPRQRFERFGSRAGR